MNFNKSIRALIFSLFCLVFAFSLMKPVSLFAQEEIEEFRRKMEENLAFLSYDMGIFEDALREIRNKSLVDTSKQANMQEKLVYLRQQLNYLDREFQSFRVSSILSYSTNRKYDVSDQQNLETRYRRLDRDFYSFALKVNQISPIKIRDRDILQDSDLAGDAMVGERNTPLYPTTSEKIKETATKKDETSEKFTKSGLFSEKDLTIAEGTEWQLKGNLTAEVSSFKVDGDKEKFEQDNFGLFARENGKLRINMDFKEEPADEADGITFGSLNVDAVSQDTLGETVNLKLGGEDFTIQVGTKLLPALSEFSLNNLEIGAFMGDMGIRRRWTLGAFAGNVNEDAAQNIARKDRKILGGSVGYKFSENTRSTAIFSEVRDVVVAALKVSHAVPGKGNVGFEFANSRDDNNNKLKGSAYRLLFKATKPKIILDGEYLNLDDDFRTQGNPEYAERVSDLKQYTLNANYKFSKHLRGIGQYISADEGNKRATLQIPTDSEDKSIMFLYNKPGAPKVTLLIKQQTKEGSSVSLGTVDQTTDFNLLKVSKKFGKTNGEVSYTTVDFDSKGTSSAAVNFKLKNPALKFTTKWNKKLLTYAHYSYQKTTGSTENTTHYFEGKAEWILNNFRKIFARFSERKLDSPVTTNRNKTELEFGYQHKPRKDYVLTYALNFRENKETGNNYDASGGIIELKRKF
ncbi:hypothetical protein ACFL35_15615 [Candidatus Riflebacteria bacterium]